MSSDQICTVCGQRSDQETCPRCGSRSQAPVEEFAQNVTDTPPAGAFDYEKEVVYLSEETDGGPTGRKKFVATTIGYVWVYGIPIMCVALAIHGRFRVLFTIGAIFGVQGAYVRYRGKRFAGPVIDDEGVRARISPPLKELCAAAHVAVPQVRVKRTVWPAAVARVNNLPTLWVSPDFLQSVDDGALHAIISHEVTHLRHDLPAPKKSQGSLVSGLFAVAYLSWFFGTGQVRAIWIYFALFFAFLFPVSRVAMFFAGFSRRKRETRADLEGAAAINDPEAMIRGLRAAYSLGPAMRRSIYGPRAFRWALFPYSLPPTIHPPLKKRIADLEAMSVPETLAHEEAHRDDPVKMSKQPIVGRVLLAATVFVLILLVLNGRSNPGVSPNVESPGGAHYVPLQNLGLSGAVIGFAPFSHNQSHDKFITAAQATAAAESSEGVHPKNGVSMTIAEGNVNNASLAVGAGVLYSPTQHHWKAAYIVVFSGPNIASEGFTGTEVVIVNAYQGAILNSFVLYDLP